MSRGKALHIVFFLCLLILNLIMLYANLHAPSPALWINAIGVLACATVLWDDLKSL